ncbi:MAG: hypothetical protein JWN28_506 [Candidatus Saccharibacteria bacterium]|nr:hypothetical protein [Candidatus Saccharibacteria bacterium]
MRVINYVLVRAKGLEPSRPKALAPKASVSTNSTTRAYLNCQKRQRVYECYVIHPVRIALYYIRKIVLSKHMYINNLL